MANTDMLLGEHDARLDNLERLMRALDRKIDTLLALQNAAKGGWRVGLVALSAMGFLLETAFHYAFSPVRH